MQLIKTGILVMIMVLCLHASAQDNGLHQATENEVELDPVTLTSSLSAVTSSKTGRNILIVKGEQFSRLPVHSIDELLRYLPGIEVQARGPQGAQSDFVLRGGTFQQVLVLLDGIRINDPNTGHFSAYIPIAPSEIERIEVLKGASSAVYGSDAVGGVVHIVTKSFAAKKGKHQQVTAQLTSGEYGLLNAQAGGFYSNGKTAVNGGLLSNNGNGQLQRGIRGYFHNNTASLSASHRFNEQWQLGVRSSYDSRDFAAQNFYTTFASDTASERVTTLWNQLRLTYETAGNKLSFNAGYKVVEDEYYFNPSSLPNNNKSRLLQALGTYEHRFSDRTSVVTGGQVQNRHINSNDRGNHSVKQAAGFVVVNQLIGASLNVNPAVRLDWDERAGTELVPQINLSYRTGPFQLRGSAGKTIRQADFTERFNNYNKALVTGGSIGNPALKSERSFSFEAGADLFATNQLKLSATYFQRNQDDLIDWVNTAYSDMPRKTNLAPAGRFALASNIAEVTTRGFETDVLYQKSFANRRHLAATCGLVWLHSESSTADPSFYISSHARFLANFNLRYSINRFSFAVNGLYKNRRPQEASPIHATVSKDYWVLNAVAEAAVWQEHLRLFAQADNLLNRQYSDLLGAQMPGRWVIGGIKLSFGK